MPSHRLTEEKCRELVEFAKGWGKIAAEEAYGPDGPGLDVDLAGLEVIAVHGCGAGRREEVSDHGITLEEITGTPAESDDVAGIPASEEEAAAKEAAAVNQAGVSEMASQSPEAGRGRWQPKRLFRTCVATLRDVHGFGPLLAAEAQRRGFYQAKRKAFIADGQEANWTVWRLHFRDFTPATDFMHAVCYAYAAAQATASEAEALWPRYLRYAAACWQGRVAEVVAELEAWLQENPLPEGVPLKDVSATDPRKVVHEAHTYLGNNRERMDYPAYRRQGCR